MIEHLEESGDIITLQDMDGNQLAFEQLDYIEYKRREFIVLNPIETEINEVVILEVVLNEEEQEEYISIEDEELLDKVYEIFKQRFQDDYHFL